MVSGLALASRFCLPCASLLGRALGGFGARRFLAGLRFGRALGRLLGGLLLRRFLRGCHFRGSSVAGTRFACVVLPLGTLTGEAAWIYTS